MVLLQWAWHYATFGRDARLITDTAGRWQYAAEAAEAAEAERRERGGPQPPASKVSPADPVAARR
jgi:hypothetical protein